MHRLRTLSSKFCSRSEHVCDLDSPRQRVFHRFNASISDPTHIRSVRSILTSFLFLHLFFHFCSFLIEPLGSECEIRRYVFSNVPQWCMIVHIGSNTIVFRSYNYCKYVTWIIATRLCKEERTLEKEKGIRGNQENKM